jgi:hypothetical protein
MPSASKMKRPVYICSRSGMRDMVDTLETYIALTGSDISMLSQQFRSAQSDIVALAFTEDIFNFMSTSKNSYEIVDWHGWFDASGAARIKEYFDRRIDRLM